MIIKEIDDNNCKLFHLLNSNHSFVIAESLYFPIASLLNEFMERYESPSCRNKCTADWQRNLNLLEIVNSKLREIW